ncbi:unnamed protein product [Euphydryas editha]|uniref:Uncharacterized protein n=1 Tax=Euphydryas editha TaxID=104508 RepID=A0AAU9TT96_EUPED|nr:unnamed protein product [Euphydryas editha]
MLEMLRIWPFKTILQRASGTVLPLWMPAPEGKVYGLDHGKPTFVQKLREGVIGRYKPPAQEAGSSRGPYREKNRSGVRVFQSVDHGSGTLNSAIVVFDLDLHVIRYHPKPTTNNITVVVIRTIAWEIALVSFYFEPDLPMGSYLAHLRIWNWIVGGESIASSRGVQKLNA